MAEATIKKFSGEGIEEWFPEFYYTNDVKWHNIDMLDTVDFKYVVFIDPHKSQGIKGGPPFVARINYKNNSIKTLNLNFGVGDLPPNLLSQLLQAIDFIKIGMEKDEPVLIIDCNEHKQKGLTILTGCLMAAGNNYGDIHEFCKKSSIIDVSLDTYYMNKLNKYQSILRARLTEKKRQKKEEEMKKRLNITKDISEMETEHENMDKLSPQEELHDTTDDDEQ